MGAVKGGGFDCASIFDPLQPADDFVGKLQRAVQQLIFISPGLHKIVPLF
jgi:hypothetical protein